MSTHTEMGRPAQPLVPSLLMLVAGLLLNACSANLNAVPDVAPADPEAAREAYLEANQRLGARDYQGAVAEYGRAIAADGRLIEAYNNRAIARVLAGERDLAVDDLDRAIQVTSSTPDRIGLLYNLGTVHLVRGFYPQASQAFERVLELDPRDRQAAINLAVACLHLDELDRAEQLLQSILAASPDHLEALANLGIVYEARGDTEQALSTYQRALDLDGEHLVTLRNLGMLEASLGLRQRAADHLEAFLRLAPPELFVERYRSILHQLRE